MENFAKGEKRVAKAEVNPNDVTSDCPAFGKGWDPKTEECAQCGKMYSDEYEACRTLCTVDRGQEPKSSKPKHESENQESKDEDSSISAEALDIEALAETVAHRVLKRLAKAFQNAV